MLKTTLLSAVLIAGASTFALAADGLQMGRSVDEPMEHPMHHHNMLHHHMRHHRVLANGRCNGISYGTGQRSCGTATGGPAGGNPSQN